MSKTETKKCFVQFGSELIEFMLQHSNRTTLAISVYPDKSVSVIAPENAPIEKIEARVRKHALWIMKQRVYFAQFLPSTTEKEFVAGESFRYLGRQYRLRIIQSSEEGVVLGGANIQVSINRANDKSRVKSLLTNWYKKRAKIIFEARLKQCAERFQNVNFPEHHLHIRKMDFRWGSCTKKGTVFLNQDLIQAPSHCIDYVICHELTHLKVRNHTPEFFKLLSSAMPDWEIRRKRLEKLFL